MANQLIKLSLKPLFIAISFFCLSIEAATFQEVQTLRTQNYETLIKANWLLANLAEAIFPGYSPSAGYRDKFIGPFLTCTNLIDTTKPFEKAVEVIDTLIDSEATFVRKLVETNPKLREKNQPLFDFLDYAGLENKKAEFQSLERLYAGMPPIPSALGSGECKPNFFPFRETKEEKDKVFIVKNHLEALENMAKAPAPAVAVLKKKLLTEEELNAFHLSVTKGAPVSFGEAGQLVSWYLELRTLRNTLVHFLVMNNRLKQPANLQGLKIPQETAKLLNPSLSIFLNGLEDADFAEEQKVLQAPGYAKHFFDKNPLFRKCDDNDDINLCLVDHEVSLYFNRREVTFGKFKSTSNKTVGSYFTFIKELALNFLFQELNLTELFLNQKTDLAQRPKIKQKAATDPILRLNLAHLEAGTFYNRVLLLDQKMKRLVGDFAVQLPRNEAFLENIKKSFSETSLQEFQAFLVEENYISRLVVDSGDLKQPFLEDTKIKNTPVSNFLFDWQPQVDEKTKESNFAPPQILSFLQQALLNWSLLTEKKLITVGENGNLQIAFDKQVIFDRSEPTFQKSVQRIIEELPLLYYLRLAELEHAGNENALKEAQSKIAQAWQTRIKDNFKKGFLVKYPNFGKGVYSELKTDFFRDSETWHLSEAQLREQIATNATDTLIAEEDKFAKEKVRLFQTRQTLISLEEKVGNTSIAVPAGDYSTQTPLLFQLDKNGKPAQQTSFYPLNPNTSIASQNYSAYPFAKPNPLIGKPEAVKDNPMASKVPDQAILKNVIKNVAQTRVKEFSEAIRKQIHKDNPRLIKEETVDVALEHTYSMLKEYRDRNLKTGANASMLLANDTVDNYWGELLESKLWIDPSDTRSQKRKLYPVKKILETLSQFQQYLGQDKNKKAFTEFRSILMEKYGSQLVRELIHSTEKLEKESEIQSFAQKHITDFLAIHANELHLRDTDTVRALVDIFKSKMINKLMESLNLQKQIRDARKKLTERKSILQNQGNLFEQVRAFKKELTDQKALLELTVGHQLERDTFLFLLSGFGKSGNLDKALSEMSLLSRHVINTYNFDKINYLARPTDKGEVFPTREVITKNLKEAIEAILKDQGKRSYARIPNLFLSSIVQPRIEPLYLKRLSRTAFELWLDTHLNALDLINTRARQNPEYLKQIAAAWTTHAKYLEAALSGDNLFQIDIPLFKTAELNQEASFTFRSFSEKPETIYETFIQRNAVLLERITQNPFEKLAALKDQFTTVNSEISQETDKARTDNLRKIAEGIKENILKETENVKLLNELLIAVKNNFDVTEPAAEIKPLLNLQETIDQGQGQIFARFVNKYFKDTNRDVDNKLMAVKPGQLVSDLNQIAKTQEFKKQLDPNGVENFLNELIQYCSVPLNDKIPENIRKGFESNFQESIKYLFHPYLSPLHSSSKFEELKKKYSQFYKQLAGNLIVPLSSQHLAINQTALTTHSPDSFYEMLFAKKIDHKLRLFWEQKFENPSAEEKKAFEEWVKSPGITKEHAFFKQLPQNAKDLCTLLQQRAQGSLKVVADWKKGTRPSFDQEKSIWSTIQFVNLFFFNYDTEYAPIHFDKQVYWIHSSPIKNANIPYVTAVESAPGPAITGLSTQTPRMPRIQTFKFIWQVLSQLKKSTPNFFSEYLEEGNEKLAKEIQKFTDLLSKEGQDRINAHATLSFEEQEHFFEFIRDHFYREFNTSQELGVQNEWYKPLPQQDLSETQVGSYARVLVQYWSALRKLALIERNPVNIPAIEAQLKNLSRILYKLFAGHSNFLIDKRTVVNASSLSAANREANYQAFFSFETDIKALKPQDLMVPENIKLIAQAWEIRFQLLDSLIQTYKLNVGTYETTREGKRFTKPTKNNLYFTRLDRPSIVFKFTSKENEIVQNLNFFTPDPKDWDVRVQEARNEDFIAYCDEQLALGKRCDGTDPLQLNIDWELTGKPGVTLIAFQNFWEELVRLPISDTKLSEIAKAHKFKKESGTLWTSKELENLTLKDLATGKHPIKKQVEGLLALHDKNSVNGTQPLTYGYFIVNLDFEMDQAKKIYLHLTSDAPPKYSPNNEERAYLLQILVNMLGVNLKDFASWERLVFNPSPEPHKANFAAWYLFVHQKYLSLNGQGQSFYTTSMPACRVGTGAKDLFRPIPVIGGDNTFKTLVAGEGVSDADYLAAMKDPRQTDLYELFTPEGFSRRKNDNKLKQAAGLLTKVYENEQPFHQRFVGLELQHLSYDDVKNSTLETNFEPLKKTEAKDFDFAKLHVTPDVKLKSDIKAATLDLLQKEEKTELKTAVLALIQKSGTTFPNDLKDAVISIFQNENLKTVKEVKAVLFNLFQNSDGKILSTTKKEFLDLIQKENSKASKEDVQRFVFENANFNSLLTVHNQYTQLRHRLGTLVKNYQFEEESAQAKADPSWYAVWSSNVKKQLIALVRKYEDHLLQTHPAIFGGYFKNQPRIEERLKNVEFYLDAIYIADRHAGELANAAIFGDSAKNSPDRTMKELVLQSARTVYLRKAKEKLFHEANQKVSNNIVEKIEQLASMEDFEAITSKKDLETKYDSLRDAASNTKASRYVYDTFFSKEDEQKQKRREDLREIATYTKLNQLVFNEYDFVKENGRLPENAQKAKELLLELNKETLERSFYDSKAHQYVALGVLALPLSSLILSRASWGRAIISRAAGNPIASFAFTMALVGFLGYMDAHAIQADFGKYPEFMNQMNTAMGTKAALTLDPKDSFGQLYDQAGYGFVEQFATQVESGKWSYSTWAFRGLMLPVYVGATYRLMEGAAKATQSLYYWARGNPAWRVEKLFKYYKELLPEGAGSQFSYTEAALDVEGLRARAFSKALEALEGETSANGVRFSEKMNKAIAEDLKQLRAELCKANKIENNPNNFKTLEGLTKEEAETAEMLIPKLNYIHDLERRFLFNQSISKEEFHELMIQLAQNSSPLVRNSYTFLNFLGLTPIFRSQEVANLGRAYQIAQGYVLLLSKFQPQVRYTLAFLTTGVENEVSALWKIYDSKSGRELLKGPVELRDLNQEAYKEATALGREIMDHRRWFHFHSLPKRVTGLTPEARAEELEYRKKLYEAIVNQEKHFYSDATKYVDAEALGREFSYLNRDQLARLRDLQAKARELYQRKAFNKVTVETYSSLYLEAQGLKLTSDTKRFLSNYEYIVEWNQKAGTIIEKFAKMHGKSQEEVLRLMLLEDSNALIAKDALLHHLAKDFREHMKKQNWKPNVEAIKAISEQNYPGIVNSLYSIPFAGKETGVTP